MISRSLSVSGNLIYMTQEMADSYLKILHNGYYVTVACRLSLLSNIYKNKYFEKVALSLP